ncbi:DEAD/DEAH box helicase [Candidatus Woesearchaeota archaeon]|nr:DEAD/DEAH box helicase [Candidatus Woesearchaeota archaeon]
MRFKDFVLDPFQEDAIRAVEDNHSVVVSAATGTGKTLIADYTIDKFLDKDRRIVYTAPIKALSNQKFKDFKRDYGEQNVGIMTGDVVVNPEAPLLVMTTEIYRNMLLARDIMVDDISYVVFDEIHYMNDPERGTVWEESIIFSPEHVRFLCLSATIPNAEQFASWIQSIKGHRVEVVRYAKRAVPLEHYVYDSEAGMTTAPKLKELTSIPSYDQARGNRRKKGRGKRGKDDTPAPKPEQVVMEMSEKLPAIVFSFSRKACENEAKSLVKKHDFVKGGEEQRRITEVYRKHFTPEVNRMRTTALLRQCLSRGVAFHHAGLLPQHKEAVEELFAEGLVQVLFATETFSVGINMPAKTVIFNGLRKFDGRSFRLINSKEYFQLAGRAGRRGIDTVGYVVALVDRRDVSMDEFMKVSKADTEPILSQFSLSINTVLNLVAQFDEAEIERILKSNFDYFLRRKQSEKQVRIMASFNNKRKQLRKMGYLTQQDELTDKGVFARYIYFEELLVSEVFATRLHESFSDVEVLQVIAGIIYEPRSNDHFSFKGVQKAYALLVKKLSRNDYVEKKLNKLSLKRMMAITGAWASGASFTDLLSLASLAEGDIIRLFRRIIDMIGQVERATVDYDLKDRLRRCQDMIDRDLVAVEF